MTHFWIDQDWVPAATILRERAEYRAEVERLKGLLAAMADLPAGMQALAPSEYVEPHDDGWQYGIAERAGGEVTVYGDQRWLASGQALDEWPRGAVIYRRRFLTQVGPWQAVEP